MSKLVEAQNSDEDNVQNLDWDNVDLSQGIEIENYDEMMKTFFLRDAGFDLDRYTRNIRENFLGRNIIWHVFMLDISSKEKILLLILLSKIHNSDNPKEILSKYFHFSSESYRKTIRSLEQRKYLTKTYCETTGVLKIKLNHDKIIETYNDSAISEILQGGQNGHPPDEKGGQNGHPLMKTIDLANNTTGVVETATQKSSENQEKGIENVELIPKSPENELRHEDENDLNSRARNKGNIIYNNINNNNLEVTSVSNSQVTISSTKNIPLRPSDPESLNDTILPDVSEAKIILEHEKQNDETQDVFGTFDLPSIAEFDFDSPLLPQAANYQSDSEEVSPPVTARRGLSGKVLNAANEIEGMKKVFDPQDLELVEELLDNLKLLRVTKTISITIERNWTTLLHAAYTSHFNYDGKSYQVPRTGWREAVRQYISVVANKKIENENYLKKMLMGKACNESNESEIKTPPPKIRPAKNIGYTSREEHRKYLEELGVLDKPDEH